MSLEAELVTQMTTHGGLVALVGTRVYPGLLPPQPTFPAVVYQMVSETPEHAMGTDPGPRMARVQATAWATSYLSALAVAAQVVLALSRFRHASAPQIFDVLMDNQLDTYDGTVRAHGIVTDFRVFYAD